MPSFANTPLSFFLLFILCVASLAASAHIPHRRHHLDSPFPYGKLADKLLHVNDVSYMIDDHDEDTVRVYPENHSVPFSSALPIASFEPKLPVLPIDNTTPRVGTKTLFSFTNRISDSIKKVVAQEWDTALIRWHKMAKVQWALSTGMSSISSIVSVCQPMNFCHAQSRISIPTMHVINVKLWRGSPRYFTYATPIPSIICLKVRLSVNVLWVRFFLFTLES